MQEGPMTQFNSLLQENRVPMLIQIDDSGEPEFFSNDVYVPYIVLIVQYYLN